MMMMMTVTGMPLAQSLLVAIPHRPHLRLLLRSQMEGHCALRLIHCLSHPLMGFGLNRVQLAGRLFENRLHLPHLLRREIEPPLDVLAHALAHHFAMVPGESPASVPCAAEKPGRRAGEKDEQKTDPNPPFQCSRHGKNSVSIAESAIA